ncbi:hypothetical protein [Saccharothrix sp. HUAS TT1]|uniref:hypothetical protein n=1 Tax=unclassified Saccharothrix TaxID=2593673 RepID=UPI00345BF3B1
MQRLRSLHPEKYTPVSNTAMDRLPDLLSLGLLAHVLRHKDDWDFKLAKLVEEKPGLTRRDASKARATLIEYGYYVVVKYRHDHKGQFATDVYRAAEPHTDEDMELLAGRYKPGSYTQIPVLDRNGEAVRDARGVLVQLPATITWAVIESWRGEEQVLDDGALTPYVPRKKDPSTDKRRRRTATADEAAEDPADGAGDAPELPFEPVDNPPAKPVDNSPEEGPGHPRARDTESGTSVRPAETGVVAGGSEVPLSDTSGTRHVGRREVFKKTSENTIKKTKTNPGGPAPLDPPTRATPADAGATRTEQPTQDPYLVDHAPKLGSNHPHAGAQSEASAGTSHGPDGGSGSAGGWRAAPAGVDVDRWVAAVHEADHCRDLAGPDAADALVAEPELAREEVERLIRAHHPELRQATVIARAIKLQAALRKLTMLREGRGVPRRGPGSRAARPARRPVVPEPVKAAG